MTNETPAAGPPCCTPDLRFRPGGSRCAAPSSRHPPFADLRSRRAIRCLALLGASTLALTLVTTGCGTKSLDGIAPAPSGGGSGGSVVPGAADAGVSSCAPSDGVSISPGFMLPASPNLTSIVTAADPPPAISGGTLLILRDGNTAVAGDADRDRLYVVELAARTVRTSIALSPHDEPGRLVQDGAGLVHVVLRGAGVLATVDVAAGKVTQRRAVCSTPRGLAYDAATNRLHVACGGGELVTFTPTGTAPERTLKVQQDLRDVVVDGTRLMVTRFRSAEVMVIDSAGTMTDAHPPAAVHERESAERDAVRAVGGLARDQLSRGGDGDGPPARHARRRSAAPPVATEAKIPAAASCTRR